MEGCSVPRDLSIQALREQLGCDGCVFDSPHPTKLACCGAIDGPVLSTDRQTCLVRRDQEWQEREVRKAFQD